MEFLTQWGAVKKIMNQLSYIDNEENLVEGSLSITDAIINIEKLMQFPDDMIFTEDELEYICSVDEISEDFKLKMASSIETLWKD